jgi:hypothetical protein
MDENKNPSQEEREKFFEDQPKPAAEQPAPEQPAADKPVEKVKFKITLADGREVNTLENITDEEVKALPEIQAIVTDQLMHSKAANVDTHRYYANIYLDPRTLFYVPLDANQYSILTLLNRKRFVDNQFTTKAKIRLIETRWPTKSYFSLDVIFDREYLKIHLAVDPDDSFITNLMLRLKMGHIDVKFRPLVRIPNQGDKEPEAKSEAPQDAAGQADPNKDLPF